MPNYCNYYMKVIGYPDNVGSFIRIINENYNYGDATFLKNPRPHLYRIFENYVDNFSMAASDILCEVYMNGYCAWSVYTCMMEGPNTYYDDNRINPINHNFPIGTINYINAGTSLLKEAARLNLIIEVFSDEPGMGFQDTSF